MRQQSLTQYSVDLRDRRFLKWVFSERPTFIGNLEGEPLDSLDSDVQAEIKAAWEEIVLSAVEATPPPPKMTEVRQLDDWHEDHGHVVWWTWRDGEWLGGPSYIGSPLCDDWPEYHTHWSPHPKFPAALTAAHERGE